MNYQLQGIIIIIVVLLAFLTGPSIFELIVSKCSAILHEAEWNVEDTRKWRTEDTDNFFYEIEEKKDD